MSNENVYFDTQADPISCKRYLKPIMWLLSVPVTWFYKTKITKTGMENVNGPYLLLGNHNSFYDFQVLTRAIFPRSAAYVVAIDAFVQFPGVKWLMKRVGCICKRKFTNDLNIIRQMIKVKDKGEIVCFYPEARYSLCGTTAVLPSSLGKFCKLLDVPVVTFMCHGHHIDKPFWGHQKSRFIKGTEAELKLVLTVEQVREMSAEQINRKLVEEFQYDDFKWQRDRGINIFYKHRARGLHQLLYQCPHCGTEFEMDSHHDILECKHCGKQWKMLTNSTLQAVEGETEFFHIPDWYEWQRENVKKEVAAGTYSTGVLPAKIRALPNSTHFLIGDGFLVHDMDGFRIWAKRRDGSEFRQEFPVPSRYSCHIEFDYHNYGHSLDLATVKDSWFLSPHDCKFSLTKVSLATEELYYAYRRSIGKECPPGLA